MKRIFIIMAVVVILLSSCGKKPALKDELISSQSSETICSSSETGSNEIQSSKPVNSEPIIIDKDSNVSSSKEPVSKTSSHEVKANYKYLEFVPENYRKEIKYPLVIFLHGAGERGTNVNRVADISLPNLAKNGKKYPFILIAPQINEGLEWKDEIEKLNTFYNYLLENLNIDKNRIYLTGNSLGGIGTWEWGCSNPEKFAALIPVCGIGDVNKAKKLLNMPIWAFHGARDRSVYPSGTTLMVSEINKFGGNAKQTIYETVQHNAWDYCYTKTDVFDWMLSQKIN